jgi:uncharacterized phage protein gp47/JayE
VSSIDAEGYHRDRLDVWVEAVQGIWTAVYGSDIDTDPDSPDGQAIGALAEIFATMDENGEFAYNASSVAGALGAALSRLVRLVGVTRKGATFSRIVGATLTGTPLTVIPAGSLAASDVDADGKPSFATAADVTIDGGGSATVDFIATEAGPVPCAAGHLVTIQTVIAGWTSVTNGADASQGRLTETDPELRRRHAQSVAGPSQGILDGLFAALLALDDVTHAKVYENPTGSSAVSSLNPHGLDPHSIYVIVDNGDPDDIAEAIWLHKSSGVTQRGLVSADVIDSQGATQTMLFDRPGEVDAYVTVTLASAVSADTKNAIIAAIAEGMDARAEIGGRVQWSNLFAPVKEITNVPIVTITLGNAASPTNQADMNLVFNYIDRWDSTPDNLGRILVLP